jgi:hypothetical protein
MSLVLVYTRKGGGVTCGVAGVARKECQRLAMVSCVWPWAVSCYTYAIHKMRIVAFVENAAA